MRKIWKRSSSRLSDLETENKQLKDKIEALERENAELREANNNVQHSAQGEPSNSLHEAISATADSGRLTDIELQRKLNENDERFNRTIQELSDLENENKQLKDKNELLERENAELKEASNNLQHFAQGVEPSNSRSQAISAAADSDRLADIELQRKLNENDERFNRTIQELRKQLSDVQSRLTVNEQVTAATQRRQLIQEGVKDRVYEKLRFDPTQEHVYAKLQPPGE